MANARLSQRPIEPAARVVWLDVLRGMALFGIAQINFPSFAAGDAPIAVLFGGAPDALSRLLFGAVQFAITAKCYPIFAFLFGYGHVLQWRSLASRGIDPPTILYRRYLALLIVGVLHGTLLFFGDILTLYALCGFALTVTGQRGFSAAGQTAVWALVSVVQLAMGYSFAGASPHLSTMIATHADEMARLAQGQLFDVMAARAHTFLGSLVLQIDFSLPQVMMLMSFGRWAAELGVWQQPGDHRHLFKWLLAIGIVAGVPVNLVLSWLSVHAASGLGPDGYWTAADLTSDLAFLLSLVLLGGLGLWAAQCRSPLPRPIYWLSCTGRMAFTNYLTQSLVMNVAWYAFWPWFSEHGAYPWLSLTALIVCVLQVAWSCHRVRAGKPGPAEALWRAFTYAPMRTG